MRRRVYVTVECPSAVRPSLVDRHLPFAAWARAADIDRIAAGAGAQVAASVSAVIRGGSAQRYSPGSDL